MSAAGMDPSLILPNVSETERNYDPISRRKIEESQKYVAMATAKVDRLAPPDLSPMARDQMIADVARRAAERGDTLGDPSRQSSIERQFLGQSMGERMGAGDGFAQNVSGSDSVLDAVGLSGLRNPETVGDLMPVVGATIGAAIPITARTKQARKALGPVMDPTIQMLRSRGIDLTVSAVGAAVGGALDLRLEQAAKYIQSGGDPAIFKEAPVVGAFIMGQGADSSGNQTLKLLNRMTQEALMDSAGAAMSAGVGAAIKKGGRMLAGDERFFRQAASDAARLGVPVGIADSAKSGLASMPRRALAPFGIIGTPFRKGIERAMGGIDAASQRISLGMSSDLAEIARLHEADPEMAGILTGRLNSNFFKKFAGAFNAYTGARNKLWGEFEELAEQSGAIVNPAHTRASAALRLKRFFGRGMAQSFKDGVAEQVEGLSKSELEILGDDVFAEIPVRDDMEVLKDIFTHVKNLEPEPSVMQMSTLGKRINIGIENVKSKTARAALIDISVGIRKDIEEGLEGASPEALQKLRAAKGLTERFHTLLTGRAGQKVGRISGDFGEQTVSFVDNPSLSDGAQIVKNAGTVDPTESIDVVMDNASIGEIEQIYGILKLSGEDGRRVFRDATARKLQKAFKIGDPSNFNAKQASKMLGLEDVAGKKRSALMRQIGLAGGNPRDVGRLIRLTNHVLRDGIADPAVFTARRAILGGLGSVVGATGLAVGAKSDDNRISTAAKGALAVFALSRYAGKILTNPKHTRDLIRVLDPSFGNSASMQALRRMASNGLLGTPEDLEAEMEAAKASGMGALEAKAEDIRSGVFRLLSSEGSRNAPQPGASVNTPLPASGTVR